MMRVPGLQASPLLVRMNPHIRIDLSLIMFAGGAYRDVGRIGISGPLPASHIGVVLRPADGIERKACPGLASIAFDLKPAKAYQTT